MTEGSWRLRLLLILVLCGPLAAAAAGSDADVLLGERLYRTGVGTDGRVITSVVQTDVPATSSAAACANCHRRSGLGSSEGRNRAPAITASRASTYDADSLRRALREGVTPDGRALDALMPRYRLGQSDVAALLAYLNTLGANSDPGVTPTHVRLATIVADSAPEAEREAVVRVITRFTEIKNSGTRREADRAAASLRQVYGERHIRGYRVWDLDVWRLHGAPDSWPQQLERYYAGNPPFAVVSGAAGTDWSVVHRFCERMAMPCILPVAPLPSAEGTNVYNLYYSDGARLAARITAREVTSVADGSLTRILLLHTDDALGKTTRDTFLDELSGHRGTSLVARSFQPAEAPTPGDWRALIERTHPDVVVAWLGERQLSALLTGVDGLERGPQRILTAEEFTDWNRIELPPARLEHVQHIYPYRVAPAGETRFPREDVWLKSQKLEGLSRIPAAQALFACHAVGEAMAGMVGNYSRDYLIETLEHMLDSTVMTTLYPTTTLGAGQRFLVKGAYVVRPMLGDAGVRFADVHWVAN